LESSREGLPNDISDHWFILENEGKKWLFRFTFVQDALLARLILHAKKWLCRYCKDLLC